MKDLFENEESEVVAFQKSHPWTGRFPMKGGQLAFQLFKTKEEMEKAVAEAPVVEGRKAYISSTNMSDASVMLHHSKQEKGMNTDIETLRKANWEKLESEVVDRIRLIRAMVKGIDQNELTDKIAQDLVLPALKLLAEFCVVVKTDDNAPKPECVWSRIGDNNDYRAECSSKIAHYMPVDFVSGDWAYCVWCGKKIQFKEVDP